MFSSSFDSVFYRQKANDDAAASGGLPAPGTDIDLNQMRHIDNAIDAALRSVSLPDGLLTRLDRLAGVMLDESADQMDWHGMA